jgi:hypothetical protein
MGWYRLGHTLVSQLLKDSEFNKLVKHGMQYGTSWAHWKVKWWKICLVVYLTYDSCLTLMNSWEGQHRKRERGWIKNNSQKSKPNSKRKVALKLSSGLSILRCYCWNFKIIRFGLPDPFFQFFKILTDINNNNFARFIEYELYVG